MRLIDADKFEVYTCVNKSSDYIDGVQSMLEAIDSSPTVDAVEVVRCKDCKYFKTRLCENEDSHDDWFCADGERKDGDGNG